MLEETRFIIYPNLYDLGAYVTKSCLLRDCFKFFIHVSKPVWDNPDQMANCLWEQSKPRDGNPPVQDREPESPKIYATQIIMERLDKANAALLSAASLWFDQQPGIIQKPTPVQVWGRDDNENNGRYFQEGTVDVNAVHLARIGSQIDSLKKMVGILDNFMMSTQNFRGE
jgi:hypothetical protein